MIDLDMGAYGGFVWPAWAISAVVLAAVVARVLSSARRWNTELKRLEHAPGGAQTGPGPKAQPE